ncbi:ABC transporter ATP-binding protein [Methylotenera mobilis]|uniref:ABC transporter related n=1 Tax=Methylotenera mobilis (strain JLW8 / ATCC BAA-1282 / DSM 17540) TaxID=583345 RepID=C6WZ56_METML|nr:ABC transporter ATP-binding protein [Methylotenera mobilis]ACT49004.1 ABC transporter related [Methylotenera mobilis JLW8]
MQKTVIEVRQLYKDYQTAAGPFPVLKDVNLSIENGDYVAIMGQSGSGKSTFMNILGCLDKPSKGEYILDGHPVANMEQNAVAQVRNKTIGFVFQGFNLLARSSLLDNVALPLVYAGVDKAERHARAKLLLEKVGLAKYLNSRPNQISGGQQQRVAIARALVNKPRLILADEPTGNLDSATSEEIMALFSELNQEGITIVLVTHEPDIAEHASRQVRFLDGRIVQDTRTKEIGMTTTQPTSEVI